MKEDTYAVVEEKVDNLGLGEQGKLGQLAAVRSGTAIL
jgi:hypothetical protein